MFKKTFCIAALIAALLCYGCAAQEPPSSVQTSQQTNPSSLISFRSELSQGLARKTEDYGILAVDSCVKSWFSSYVASRVVPIDPEPREPVSFGPWSAEKDYGTVDAREDGSLTEWADDYYITHDWSDIGQQILSLIPGDTVTVNGQTMRVEGIFNYPKDSYYDEILEVVGSNVIGFQTCYPDSDYNRIVYGKAI